MGLKYIGRLLEFKVYLNMDSGDDASYFLEYLECKYPEPAHVEVCDWYPRYVGHWEYDGKFYRYVISNTWLEYDCY